MTNFDQIEKEFDVFLNSGKLERRGGLFNGDTSVVFEHDQIMLKKLIEQLRTPIKSFFKSKFEEREKELMQESWVSGRYK